jgi:alpha-tubulin suppressor-like RCC1 family protein
MLGIRGINFIRLIPLFFLLTLWLSPLAANAANLTGLSLAPPNPTVQVGKYIQLTATGTYDDGTTQVIAQAKQVNAGRLHACALGTDGAVKCWGSNEFGQLGDGNTTDLSTPVAVNGINNAVAVGAGSDYTCALIADGTIKCWGINVFGQLGDGTTSRNSLTPVNVSGISNAVAVSVGNNQSCAVLADATVRCWGNNYFGQLGNGTTIDSSIPVTVSGLSSVVAVNSGDRQTCAVLVDGTVRCWGWLSGSSTPVTVSGLNTAVAVSVGHEHICALLANHGVQCWGANIYGQLGNGTSGTGTDFWTPVTVINISTAVAISAGGFHTCAALADGTLRCWGRNTKGELGNGTTIDSSTPVTVSGLNAAVAVSAGIAYTCALLANGRPWCWGTNAAGRLGNGTTSDSLIPVSTLGFDSLAWDTQDNNPPIVSVDGIGRVKGLAPGEAKVTVSADGYSAVTGITILGSAPITSNVNVTAVSGTTVGWTPVVSDPNGDSVICRLGTPPANGIATVASDCASGTYQSNDGFIGTDSFTYIANDGKFDSSPGTVAVTEPPPTDPCLVLYPVTQFTQTGKQGTLSITFTGNITSHTHKEVKVCPGTTLDYQSTSTQGPVICKIRNSTTRGSGTLRVNDHLKCTDKPVGKDKLSFKVKSGAV